MNHLTTEPIESKSGDGSSGQNFAAVAEQVTQLSQPTEREPLPTRHKPRPTFVPPLDPTIGIELRVTRAGMPARRLRINSTRCTFGSGEGCTVRLSDASLRPLHAVILRDGGRIMIRGYSVPLEVNGQPVAEAPLTLGDVIRLGQYCFEMIDLPSGDIESDRYEEETVETPHRGANRDATAGAGNVTQVPKRHSDIEVDSAELAVDRSASNEAESNPKRLKFSQPPSPRKGAAGPSTSQSVLDGLQVSQSNVQVVGRNDDLLVDELKAREPVTSLAQIHVQAKRNSELMAELALVRQREQEANEKLASIATELADAQSEVAQASQTAETLRDEISELNVQIARMASDSKERETIVAAEQAKLNRAIASLRESGAASQKAEAATRQALQESIRQRDDALAQRAVAIDAEQLTRSKLSEAEAQIRRLQQQAEESAKLLKGKEAEANKSIERVNELKDVCCGQADQITKLSMALESSQVSELATAAKLKSTVEQLQAELDAGRQLARNSDMQRVQITTLQSTLDSTLQEHIAEKLAWGTRSAEMTQKVEELSAAVDSVTEQLRRWRGEATTLQSEATGLRSLIATVEAELANRPTAEQLHQANSQLAQAETDLQNAEQQLARLREDYDALASERVAEKPAVEYRATSALGLQQPIAPSANTGALPISVFPVPAYAEPMTDSSLAVEATHTSNVQEIVASAAAAFALQRSTSESHKVSQPIVVGDQSGSTADGDQGEIAGDDLNAPSNVTAAWSQSELDVAGPAVIADQPSQVVVESQNPKWELKTDAPEPDNGSRWRPQSASASVTNSGWNVATNPVTADETPSPKKGSAKAIEDGYEETKSQWLTSSHSRTEMMQGDQYETPMHTEPMSRFGDASVEYSATQRMENIAGDEPEMPTSWSAHSSATFDKSLPNDIQADSNIDSERNQNQPEDNSNVAAFIQRPEGTSSSWFADYTTEQTAENDSDEPDNEPDNEDDNDAVMARLSQYVRDSEAALNDDAGADDFGGADDGNEYGEMDPEASALSLARMLINELDSATSSDRDSKLGPFAPDPMVKSKRLVGAAIAEEGGSGDDQSDDEDADDANVEMRRKDFDERAFRNSFSGTHTDDVVDPNADEAAYTMHSEPAQEIGYRSAPASPAVEEEEDSVEAYMNQLLRRMGQEPLPSTPSAAPSSKAAASKYSAPKPTEAQAPKLEFVRPKRTAAELEVPMDQMRELANQSAESAISTSNRKGAKEMRSKAMVDGAQAAVVVICALVFFYCGMSSSNLKLVWNTAGALALALAAFFLYEMFRKLTAAAMNR